MWQDIADGDRHETGTAQHGRFATDRRDPQQERIVEMRFFGGLTVEETAAALEISPATVKRDWSMAKAWLTREVGRSLSGKDRPVGEDQGAV